MGTLIPLAGVLVVAALCWYGLNRLMSSGSGTSMIPVAYRPMIASIGRWAIGLVTAIVIMRILGFTPGQVLASLSAFALVAAVAFFAYWSVLSNGLCSLLLYLFQPFRVGDWIEMRENENNIVAAGKVSGINLIFVTLTFTDDDGIENEFQIPTNLMFQRTIRVIQGEDTKSLGQHYAEHHGHQVQVSKNEPPGSG